MRRLIFCLNLILILTTGRDALAQKAVVLVRHAEKAAMGQDPSLSQAGEDRAKSLAILLQNLKIRAIYTSDTLRTQQTAKPLADKLGLTSITIKDGDPGETIAKIKADHADDIVLVVGHSNTVPEMVKTWSPGADAEIDDDEFDKVFLVTPLGDGNAGWMVFRYRGDGK